MLIILLLYIFTYLLNLRLFQIQFSNKEFLMLLIGNGVILTGIMLILNRLKVNGTLIVLLFLEVVIVGIYLLCQKTILQQLFFLLLSFLVLLTTSQFSEVLLYKVFKISYLIQENSLHWIWVNVLIALISDLLIVKLLNWGFQKLHTYQVLQKHKLTMLITSLMTIVMLMGYFYLMNHAVTTNQTITQISFLFLGTCLLFILTFLLWSHDRNQQLQLQLEKENRQQLIAYLKTLENAQQEFRKFKHDYLNVLSGMAGYIEDQDLVGLKKYFYGVIQNNQVQQTTDLFNLSSLSNLKIVEIKGLLAVKLGQLTALKNRVHVEIAQEVRHFPRNVSILDYNRCLGILLDNAIEAIEDLDEKTSAKNLMTIIIYADSSQLTTIIKNHYQDAINLKQIYQINYSTKDNHSGLGLANIKEITHQYSNFSLQTEVTKEEFIQKLIITKEQ